MRITGILHIVMFITLYDGYIYDKHSIIHVNHIIILLLFLPPFQSKIIVRLLLNHISLYHLNHLDYESNFLWNRADEGYTL